VRTFVRCALLLSAQRVFGRSYHRESDFYDRVERDLALGVMRSHFHLGYPKGAFCCAPCSLALYPVLEAGAIRWFDCKPLAATVRGLVEARTWRFTKATSPRMVAWSLGTED